MKKVTDRAPAFWRRWTRCKLGAHQPDRYGVCVRCGYPRVSAVRVEVRDRR